MPSGGRRCAFSPPLLLPSGTGSWWRRAWEQAHGGGEPGNEAALYSATPPFYSARESSLTRAEMISRGNFLA